MKTKYLVLPRIPLLLVTAVLSTGLLLTACNDKKVTETATEDSATVVADPSTTEATVATDQVTTAETEDNLRNENMLANEGVQITDSSANKNETAITNDNINPMTNAASQPSLVTNPTEAGTPEDTVKKALNTLYYGDIKEAVSYYKVDMANFEQELANTQSAFQQTVEGVTITNTQYSVDKEKATITGELRLKGQSKPAPLTYQLQKVNGQWKILG